MNRTREVRISIRTDQLLQIARVMTHSTDGKQLTKAEMAEKLIYLGVVKLSQSQGWEIPDDLKS